MVTRLPSSAEDSSPSCTDRKHDVPARGHVAGLRPREALVMVGLYLAAAIPLAVQRRNDLNPDGTAYLDITRAYADGNWADAVNGCWSPLYSWLLAVPVVAGADPLLAARLLNIGSGAVALGGTHLLLRRLQVDRRASIACFGALGVLFASWAVGGIVPDLLTVALGLLYIRVALAAFDQGKIRVAVGSGVLAGVAYLAKAAFLPFFVLMTATLLLVHVRRDRTWRRHLSTASAAFIGAVLLVVPWAVTISTKYERPTIGTASSYNLAIIGPGWNSLSVAHPQDTAGLLPPPSPSATSAWTDPSLIPVPAWDLLSVDGIGHELRNIALNVGASLEWTVRYWILAPLVVIWPLSRARRTPDRRPAGDIPIVAAAALLMSAVYLPLLVESRYLWLPFALLPVVGAAWWASAQRRPPSRRALGILVIGTALLVAQPVHNLMKGPDPTTGDTLATTQQLRAMGVQGNVASNANWSEDLYIAHHLEARYYGTVADADPDTGKSEQLARNDIQYFLLHDEAVPSYLHDYTVVGALEDGRLTVLRRT